MLPCQRALFDIPREVCFLNAASWSPLPLAVQEAGRAAVGHKGQPWKLPADFQPKQYERARKAAAALIGADSGGFKVEMVKQPADGDWTSAVMTAIDRSGAEPLALVSISSVHWSDGGALDMARIATTAKAKGSALLVDATHDFGIRHIDVKKLDPDFLIFPTYKWV